MRLSQDKRLMTFVGRRQDGSVGIYVDLVPGTSAPVLAADRFFRPALWSRDGRHIYYEGADRTLMRVAVRTVPSLTVGPPEPLFKLPPLAVLMDVFLDGGFLLHVRQVPPQGYADKPIAVWTAAVASTQR